ncbi:unnamed protein product [Sphagnum jensenii]|uniref:Uncharacterized protein n=1 Tax=Sphagnum jensenii TaxID=128206 RepID=A0ABP1BGZ0_9BRYO
MWRSTMPSTLSSGLDDGGGTVQKERERTRDKDASDEDKMRWAMLFLTLIAIPDSTTLPDRISSRRRRRLRRNLLLEMAAAKGQQQRLKNFFAVVATGLQIYVLKELVF